MELISPPDSYKISFKIIEAVKNHPVLYINDVKGVDMKLQDFRHKVWQYIAEDLGLEAKWIKLRWKNLKNTYCRIVKYKNKPEKGLRRKKWIFEDHLNFLTFPFEPNYVQHTCEVTEEYMQLIQNNKISSEGLLEQLEDKNDEDYNEFLEVVQTPEPSTSQESTRSKPTEAVILQSSELNKEMNKDFLVQKIESKFRKIKPKTEIHIEETSSVKNNVLSNSPVSVTEVEPPKKKRKIINNVVNNHNYELETSVQRVKSSLELFFDSMAKTVKKFPEDLQTNIKFNICKVIAEAESKSKKEITAKKQDPIHTLPKLLLIPCHMIDKVK